MANTTSPDNDTIVGTSANELIYGANGADSIDGGAGNDVLIGENFLVVNAYGANYQGQGPLLRVSAAVDNANGQTVEIELGTIRVDTTDSAGKDYYVALSYAMSSIKKIHVEYFNDALGGSEDRSPTIRSVTVGSQTQAAYNVVRGYVVDIPEVGAYVASNGVLAYAFNGTGNAPILEFGNDTLNGGSGTDSMYGGAGDDTYYVSVGSDLIVEAADEGHDTVFSNTALYALTDNVEDVVVTRTAGFHAALGNKLDNVLTDSETAGTLLGEEGNDRLYGNGGNDVLYGGYGDDFIRGGTGNDSLIGDDMNEYTAIVGGNDTLFGDAGDDNITGQEGDDLLVGGDGNDTLRGGDGTDVLNGGSETSFVVRARGDQFQGAPIMEVYVNGIKVDAAVVFSVSVQAYTVTTPIPINAIDTVEVRFNNDAADGMGGDRNLHIESITVGDMTVSTPSQIYGGSWMEENGQLFIAGSQSGGIYSFGRPSGGANDTLGAVSFDSMEGGLGDDTYVVDSANDVVTEVANFDADGNYQNGGIDTVISSISYAAGLDIENLTLINGGTAVNATGNALDNILLGNSANNLLVGQAGNDFLDGGAGNDTMQGGTEDDTYVVDAVGDVVTESVGAGTDTVISKLDYVLTANLENLALAGSAINGTGNGLDNVISGNALANHLYGDAQTGQTAADDTTYGDDTLSGGGGADTLEGGLGNDVYLVTNEGTTIVEVAGAASGNDTVYVSNVISYTLSTNLENAEISAATSNGDQETATYFLTGNASNNHLVGSFNSDSIAGLSGNDTIEGGFGNDTINGDDGNDSLSGEDGDDSLSAGVGLDTLDGGAGNDTLNGGTNANAILRGGSGGDYYFVGNAGITIEEDLSDTTSRDQVHATVNYTLADGVEDMDMASNGVVGIGNGLDNNLYANFGKATLLQGLAGNDTLVGYNTADTLEGGIGDDAYDMFRGSANIVETATGGIDTIIAWKNNFTDAATGVSYYQLGTANVENLTLSVDAAAVNLMGDGNANEISGNNAANILKGMGGNDTLIAGAGDTLLGGLGNDTYVINGTADYNGQYAVITENAGEGTDTVQLQDVHLYTLADNVENAVTTVSETYTESLTRVDGNASNNVIVGSAIENLLDGLQGDDMLIGGVMNDRLYGSEGNDVLAGGEGDDDLNGGEGNDSLLGGDGNDDLSAGAGIDTLDGGAGEDTLISGTNTTMRGGEGSDRYFVNSSSVVIYEDVTDTTSRDLVHANVDFTLTDGLEDLELLFGNGLIGIGNGLDNHMSSNYAEGALLQGLGGNDTLVGYNVDDTLEGGVGNDTYSLFAGSAHIVETATGGIDTIEAWHANYTDTTTGKTFYQLNIANVENLTLYEDAALDNLMGDDNANEISGNSAANILKGMGGNDTLIAGAGDTLLGGLGNDTYVINGTSPDYNGPIVTISENAGEGTDTVQLQDVHFYTLGDNIENAFATVSETYTESLTRVDGNAGNNLIVGSAVENLLDGLQGNDLLIGGAMNDRLYGSEGNDLLAGGEGDDDLNGGDGNDSLLGGDGNDSLSAGAGIDTLDGGAGDDTLISGANTIMSGGDGSDRYVVNGTSVVIYEDVTDTTSRDLVHANVDFTLTDGLEDLELLFGNGLIGIGNGLDNHMSSNYNEGALLQGLVGNDTLLGYNVDDTLEGGVGNDTYSLYGGDANVLEAVNGGIDTIEAYRANYTDAATGKTFYQLNAANVENVTLYEYGTLRNAMGDDNANGISGNSGANLLRGMGGNDTLNGEANDTLEGGAGDDQYIVTASSVIVNEVSNEGNNDTVITKGLSTYTLTTNVEHASAALNAQAITLNGNGGDNQLTGSALGDLLTGGIGNDTLDGGLGNDTLNGGTGNDTYVIDVAADVITGEGTTATEIDTVIAGFNYTLATNLENLTLREGSGATTATGNGVNNVVTGNSLNNTLGGAGGNDILIGGEGNDSLDGGTGNDSLDGGANNDTLNGGTGNDTLNGGLGNDTYYLDVATDSITGEGTTATEIDTVIASFNYTLASNLENLTLLEGSTATTATGNAANNVITGNSLNNTLSGAAGNDSLNGGAGNDNLSGGDGNDTLEGGLGNDTLSGGLGNDTYYINVSADSITGEGTSVTEIDTVVASFNYTLAANLENLTLLEGSTATTATGNGVNNVITGNSLNNTLSGAVGNDILSGGAGNDSLDGGTGNDSLDGGTGNDTLNGGAGNDVLSGGAGNDTYYLDVATDSITGEGASATEIDTVIASFNYTLASNLENLTLLEGSTATTATGNGADNIVTGNSLNNTLSGAAGNDSLNGGAGNDNLSGGDGNDTLNGGAGNDTLNGGLGNDTYYIDVATDSITGEGTSATEIDTVIASFNYTLASNLENLTLLQGSTATTATGNTGNNVITGNSLNNTLSGATGNDSLDGGAGNDSLSGGDGNDTLDGGAGNDTLNGGLGNDTYYINVATDTITGEGTLVTEIDTVMTLVNYTLGTNLENLTLMEFSSATTGTGNSGNNVINGNELNNTLNGAVGNDTLFGGAGNDIIDGGAGNDAITGGTGNDTLSDTTSSNDSYFWGLSMGADTLNDVGGTDALSISGAVAEKVWFSRAGADVTVTLIGTTDTFKVSNFYSATTGTTLGAGAMESLTLSNGNAGDTTLSGNNVANLISAMSAFSATPPAASTTLSSTVLTAIQSNWA